MNETEKTIKQMHKEDICLFKIGSFYHSYNRDAYIISYLFDYKIKSVKQNNKECGFPLNIIDRVTKKLKDNKINYVIIEENLEKEFSNNEDENRYSEMYIKANTYISYKLRIENISNFLIENLEQKNIRKMIEKIEEVIYEAE